jgi:hypothetical protein
MAIRMAAKPARHRRQGPARPVPVDHPGAERRHEHDGQAEQPHYEPGEPVVAAAGRQREEQGKTDDPVTQASDQ